MTDKTQNALELVLKDVEKAIEGDLVELFKAAVSHEIPDEDGDLIPFLDIIGMYTEVDETFEKLLQSAVTKGKVKLLSYMLNDDYFATMDFKVRFMVAESHTVILYKQYEVAEAPLAELIEIEDDKIKPTFEYKEHNHNIAEDWIDASDGSFKVELERLISPEAKAFEADRLIIDGRHIEEYC